MSFSSSNKKSVRGRKRRTQTVNGNGTSTNGKAGASVSSCSSICSFSSSSTIVHGLTTSSPIKTRRRVSSLTDDTSPVKEKEKLGNSDKKLVDKFKQECEKKEQELEQCKDENEYLKIQLMERDADIHDLQEKYATVLSEKIHAACKKNKGSQLKNPFSVIFKNPRNTYQFMDRGEIMQTTEVEPKRHKGIRGRVREEEAVMGGNGQASGKHQRVPNMSLAICPLSDLPPLDLELALTPASKNPVIELKRIDMSSLSRVKRRNIARDAK